MGTLRESLSTPQGKGFARLAITAACFSFAMAAQQNIVSNYFEHSLGLTPSQFGYITAIREIPGFLLIFLAAVFYRMSLPHLTAGALCLLAVGFAFFGFSSDFWSVAPWVIISSMGYHTFLQTQYALGMSLVTEKRSGGMLGRVSAIGSGGGMVAMIFVLIGFSSGVMDYWTTYIVCGVVALIAAAAIFGFPNLHNGQQLEKTTHRSPIVLRKHYRWYYFLNLLDGGRQQIFFSFGLFVLVHRYQLDVPFISAVLIGVSGISMVVGTRIGRLIDIHGERQILALVNIGYIIALAGYALVDNIVVAVICYIIYSFIMPLSGMGGSVYLRKVAASADIAPSLAMGVTMQHVAAIAVPLAAGYILNFVGYQVPFLIACGFACLSVLVTRQLRPELQKSPQRRLEDAAALELAIPTTPNAPVVAVSARG